MSKKSVCVIGAGVVGLCSAEALLRLGYEVTVMDGSTPGEGCSFGNGGLLVPSHFEPLANPGTLRTGLKMLLQRDGPFGLRPGAGRDAIRWMLRFVRSANQANVDRNAPLLKDLHLASQDLYREMSARLGFDFGFAKRGLLMVCRTAKGFESERQLAKTAEQMCLPATVYSRAELAKSYPGVEGAGAVYFEDDAEISPRAFMKGMRAHLLRAGVKFRDSQKVSRFESRAGRILEAISQDSACSASEFVLCGGAWSGTLARTLQIHLPVLAGRGCGFTLPRPLEGIASPLILTEARVAVTPYQSETRFVGLMELGGPGSECSRYRIARMRREISAALPQVSKADLEALQVWVGNRPCMPDGMPVIGKPSRWPNLTIATGHAMIGMSLGPITGKLVAQLVSGQSPSCDMNNLSPDRFEV